MADTYAGKLPVPTPETQPYWDAAKEGVLLLPKCDDCGGWTYYPRPFCMHCFSKQVTWTKASGKATIYSYAINHLPVKGFDDPGPVVILVAQLAEGPRMISNLKTDGAADPEKIALDAPIEIGFRQVTDDIALPFFQLTQ